MYLQRENKWTSWKKAKCPEFTKADAEFTKADADDGDGLVICISYYL
jgi:hypothetical protein